MPRVTGTSKQTERWNISNDAKFQELAHKGKIDINNITPVFIETIQPHTSAPITVESWTLSDSLKTSMGQEH